MPAAESEIAEGGGSRRWAIAVLALFLAASVWIQWSVKRLDISLAGEGSSADLMNHAAPGFSLPSLSGRTVALAD